MKKIGFVFVVGLFACGITFAQTQYKVLWNFAGFEAKDGASPRAGVVFDREGNIYGTTYGGGSRDVGFCEDGGCGTVFRLSPNPDGSWKETILYSFCAVYSNGQCLDGAYPQASLVLDGEGNLYGTTYSGGPGCGFLSSGCGVVFELSASSSPDRRPTETVLYTFCSNYVKNRCVDGAFPTSQLILDSGGNLYGTASMGGTGGAIGSGIVFELAPVANGWTETVLYNFCSLGSGTACPDGALPMAAVTLDHAGNLYGTTQSGGENKRPGGGTVYKLSPGSNGWSESIVLTPNYPYNSGSSPVAPVTIDPLGRLFTTFSLGGPSNAGGVVRIEPGGSNGFYSFNGSDGEDPTAGVLVDPRNNILYGSTYTGGAKDGGTAFQIAPTGQELVLYSFCSQANCADGAGPSNLVEDKSGNLYGTAKVGGSAMNCAGLGCGVVFEITSPQNQN